MADTFTTGKSLTKQTIGGNQNTWGDVLNTNMDRIDSAISGPVAISISGDTSLTDDQAKNIFYDLSGTLTGDANITFPTYYGIALVRNNTTGGFVLTAKMASGATVSIPNGRAVMVISDGSNFRALTVGEFDSGTKLLFPQASAPVGWTLNTDVTDSVLRVVDSAGGGTGGSWTISGLGGTAASHVHSGSSHQHGFSTPFHQHATPSGYNGGSLIGNSAAYGQSTSGNILLQSVAIAGNITISPSLTNNVIENDSTGVTSAAGTGNTGATAPALTITAGSSWRPQYLDVIKASKD
jgi:hypothetical protein